MDSTCRTFGHAGRQHGLLRIQAEHIKAAGFKTGAATSAFGNSIELLTAFLLVCTGSQRTCCHREPATCRSTCAYRHNKDTKGVMLSSKRCRWQPYVEIVSMSAETVVSMNGKRLWSPCLSVRALYRYVPQLWKMAMASSKNSVKGWGTWTVPEDCGRVSRASHTSLSLL